MKTKELEIQRDGLTLRGVQTLPETESFDVAVLFHGFLMDCGRTPDSLILQMSEALAARGIGTVRLDFAGQGQSDGASGDMSVLSELLDASKILQYARSIPGLRRLYVHGQSQGGVVASMIAGVYPDWIDKLALTSAAATMVDDAKAGNIMDGHFDPYAVPETQNVLGQTIGGFYFRTNQKLPIYEWAANYKGPVCIVHCEGDAIVNKRAALRYHEIYENSTLHILPGGNHAMKDDAREPVLKLVADYFTT